VRRAVCAVSKKLWRSFGYNNALATIQARLCEVIFTYYAFELTLMTLTLLSLFPDITEGN
jgi:hypothetical protein